MVLIGLYSGQKIKRMAAKGERVTRTQTAKQALTAINKKYGKVVYSAHYRYAGKNNWVRYSKESDRKTTSKVTMRKDKWRSQPHKLDYPGIDTGPGHKTPSKSKLINYSLKNRMPLLKRCVQANGGKSVKVSIVGTTLKLSYADGPSIEKATKDAYDSIDNLCRADIKKAYPKDYGKLNIDLDDYKISIDRRFSSEVQRYIKNSGGTPFDLNKENISDIAFERIKKSPMSKPGYGKLKPESKGKYRYGSFMRPLWAGFSVTVPFKIVTPKKSDEDPKRGRLPHSVIVTNKVIPKKELEYFELTDIRDIQKVQEIYKYIESLDIADRHKGHLRRLYDTGRVSTKADINKLASKVKKPGVKLSVDMIKEPKRQPRTGAGPKARTVLKRIPKKEAAWDFKDTGHIKSPTLTTAGISHDNLLSDAEKLKWAGFELERVNDNLIGERAVYSGKKANSVEKATKARKVKYWLDQKKILTSYVRNIKSKGKQRAKKKLKYKYISLETGEGYTSKSGPGRGANLVQITTELTPLYEKTSDGINYLGWKYEGTTHNRYVQNVKNPIQNQK